MNSQPPFGVMPLPQPCDDCLLRILALAEEHREVSRLSHFCPHNFVLVMAEIADREGDQG